MKVVGVGLLLLGSAGGCSAPKACEPSFDGPGKELTGSTEGSFELDPTASPEQIELVASVTGLPKLWGGSSNLRSGYLQLALTLEYVDEPKGNDGKTEMPRVQTKVSVGSERSFLDPISSSFPNGATTGGRHELFETCSDLGDPGCCEYGAETCSLPVVISFERLDREPFPAISVAWRAEAGVTVSPCPLEDEVRAELRLEQAEP